MHQVTILLYGGALAVIGMLFHFYAPVASCRLNIFFIAWTLVLGVVATLLSARMPRLSGYPDLYHAGSCIHPCMPSEGVARVLIDHTFF